MSKAALLELAERVEKASGEDRELDALVAAACGLMSDFDPARYISPPIYVGIEDGTIRAYVGKIDDSPRYYVASRKAAPFTSSLDAAMTLVPVGWWLTLDRYSISDVPDHQQHNWRVWLKILAGDVDGDGPCGLVEKFAIGHTPALTLTAASLRAHAQQESKDA